MLGETLAGFDERKFGDQTQICAIGIRESAQCKSCYLQCACALNGLGTCRILLFSAVVHVHQKNSSFLLSKWDF